MFLKWPLSKILVKFWSVHEQGSGEWGLLDYMNINKIKKKIFSENIGQILNNLIEMFLEWPFSELFLKFWSVNKHGISEWRLLALYRHKEILVNSSLKATKKKNWQEQSKEIRWAIQGHLGPLVSLSHHIKQQQNKRTSPPELLKGKYCVVKGEIIVI